MSELLTSRVQNITMPSGPGAFQLLPFSARRRRLIFLSNNRNDLSFSTEKPTQLLDGFRVPNVSLEFVWPDDGDAVWRPWWVWNDSASQLSTCIIEVMQEG